MRPAGIGQPEPPGDRPEAPPTDYTGRLPLPPTRPRLLRDEEEVLERARGLAEDFRVGAAERDRRRLLPWDELEALTASGLLAITIPPSHGGLGASKETLARLFTILCAADPSLGQIPQNHFALIEIIKTIGNENQKQRFFSAVLEGARLGNAGPERKSRARTLQTLTTQIRHSDGGLRVSGTRFYSTGSIFAHWIPFQALDVEGRPALVIVRRDARGVQVIDDWSSFGQRTTASGTVEFHEVEIEPGNIFPLWPHLDVPALSAPISQLIQASIDAGIAQGALDDGLAFIHAGAPSRIDPGLGRANLDPYLIQEVGRLRIDVDAAHETLFETARLLDELGRHPIDAAAAARASVAIAEAKILTTEAALSVSEELLALAGESATRADLNLDRHWRNARVHTLHDPVRWKYHLIGNHLLNGVHPKRHQWN